MNPEIRKTIQTIEQHNICPTAILWGDETWSKSRFVKHMRRHFGDPAMAEFNESRFEADKTPARDVLAVADEMPMMAAHRFITVENLAHWGSEDWAQIRQYAKNPNPTTCLIMDCGEKKPHAKQAPKPSEHVFLLPFVRPKPWEIPKYVEQLAREAKLNLSPDARELLADYVGDNLMELEQHLEKLSLFALDRPAVSEDDVAALLGKTRKMTCFELNQFIAERNPSACLQKMHEIFDSGEEPLALLATLHYFIRQLFVVKQHMIKGTRTASALASAMQIHPKIAQGLMSQQKNFSDVELRAAFHEVREADRRLRTYAMNRRFIMDQLICRIAAPGHWSPPHLSKRA